MRGIFGGVCLILFVSMVSGNCSFSRNLEGNWSIEKDGRELGRMSVDYTRMDVTFMGQTYIYTCNAFDYNQEKYLLRSANGNGMACLLFTPFSNGGNTLMMIRLHMTHLYDDKSFFKPQQVAGSPTMDSVCNNFDDGQMLFIHYLP
uniref:Uncharacterized protein LOC111123511 n=1 Tax=Crassostrea virginica TaxID=6565 RepID=A0A8B8D0K3_CRAVI|nr:uncharacterized protein LOC111123511 [Crassostrea virginica]